MQYKETRSLFLGTYQYKVVLVCPTASLLRGGDFDGALEALELWKPGDSQSWHWQSRIKTPADYDYCKSLAKELKKLKDFEIRIEQPNVNIYTNVEKDVTFLQKKYSNNIKYISKPPSIGILEEGYIVMPKMNFDYKITMGATRQEYSSFITWADSNAKVKLTNSCVRDLTKTRSWGGTHFYITGDNNLLLAKMHLGSSISKVQRIVKQLKD
jgi:hypothetical protein